MPRGPIPKPAGLCPSCARPTSIWKRGFCHTCYTRGLNQGAIQKLERPDAPLTELQVELLEGMMLGDGCLYRHKPTHLPYLAVQRKLEDQPYLEWQAQQFQGYMKKPVYTGEVTDKRTENTYYWCRFVTRRVEAFAATYARWYPDDIKRVPNEMQLTPLTLAVWFADDGSCCPSCSPWRIKAKIATHGFKASEVERLAHLLTQRYQAHFGVGRDRERFFLHTADAGARSLAKEIDPLMSLLGMDRKCRWREPSVRFYENSPKIQPGWKSKGLALGPVNQSEHGPDEDTQGHRPTEAPALDGEHEKRKQRHKHIGGFLELDEHRPTLLPDTSTVQDAPRSLLHPDPDPRMGPGSKERQAGLSMSPCSSTCSTVQAGLARDHRGGGVGSPMFMNSPVSYTG